MSVVIASAVHRRAREHGKAISIGAVVAWIALVVGARIWGVAVLHAAPADLHVGAIPFFGSWRWHVSTRTLVPIGTGMAGVGLLPAVAARCSWRYVLLVVACGAFVFGAALSSAKADGTAWTSIRDDYGIHVHLVDEQGAGGFLQHYVDGQATFPTHLQAHPPGMVFVLWVAAQVGLRGLAFEGTLALAGAAAGAVATVAVLRAVAGEQWARRAAPFVVLAPAAVWHTNADTFYAGVALVAVACIVRAITDGNRRLAAVGGVVFGGALLLTYGVLLLAVVPLVLAVRRARLDTFAVAAGGCVVVLLVAALWGFSWLAGLAATKHQYDVNLARVRPYDYFVIGNLAVFAVAVGPATALALARLRDRATWLLVGSGLAVVVAADVSGLALAETERIWQPFMPLVLIAGAALSRRDGAPDRRWLSLQVGGAVLLQAALRSPW